MTKTIKGDLVLTGDFEIDDNLVVRGNIRCENGIWDIRAHNIHARDIDAWNIDAWNIHAEDIHARDIHAWDIRAHDIHARDIDAWNIRAEDIHARDIDAWNIHAEDIHAHDIRAHDIHAEDIICVSRKKKKKDTKTIAFSITTKKFNRELHEVMPEKETKASIVTKDGTKIQIEGDVEEVAKIVQLTKSSGATQTATDKKFTKRPKFKIE